MHIDDKLKLHKQLMQPKKNKGVCDWCKCFCELTVYNLCVECWNLWRIKNESNKADNFENEPRKQKKSTRKKM